MLYYFSMDSLLFLAFMIPGTFFLGLYDIFVKKFLSRGFSASLLLGGVYGCSGCILLTASFFLGIPELQPMFWSAFLGTLSLNVVSQLLWYKAFEREEASLISPLRMLTPPFVLFTGILFLHEIPSLGGILGVMITMIGLWLLLDGEKKKHETNFLKIIQRRGVVYGLIGALLFAISFPLDKKAILASSTLFFAATIYLSLGGIYLVWNLLTNRSGLKNIVKEKNLLPFVLFHAIGGFLTFQALHYTLAAYAAGTKRLWSVWTVLLSGSLLKEQHIGRKLLATSIMLLGIIISLVIP